METGPILDRPGLRSARTSSEFCAASLEQSSAREPLSQVQHAMLTAPEVRAAVLSLPGGLACPGQG